MQPRVRGNALRRKDDTQQVIVNSASKTLPRSHTVFQAWMRWRSTQIRFHQFLETSENLFRRNEYASLTIAWSQGVSLSFSSRHSVFPNPRLFLFLLFQSIEEERPGKAEVHPPRQRRGSKVCRRSKKYSIVSFLQIKTS